MIKIATSFTVCRQSDRTILRSAEYKRRYYSECGRRNARFKNKQVTRSELILTFYHATKRFATTNMHLSFYSCYQDTMILILKKTLRYAEGYRGFAQAPASSGASRTDVRGICNNADVAVLQDRLERRMFQLIHELKKPEEAYANCKEES